MPIVAGDDLEPLMAGTGWSATQSAVEASKVNAYAEEMANGNWQWTPQNRQNPLIVDQAGSIMSGHHRLVAAQVAGVPVPVAGVPVPVAAIQRFPGMTSRPVKSWRGMRVR